MTTPLGHLSPEELSRHASWLRLLARRLVGGAGEAEDLAQDVWVELARGSGPVAHLRAFTARIARRLASRRMEAARARQRREVRAARAEALPGPEELREHLETQRLLFRELSELDEVHRRPLLLAFYEGLSAAEIARRSGAPETTVRSQIQRALEELRARLDRRHGGERRAWVAQLARLPKAELPAGEIALGSGTLAFLAKATLVAGASGALVLAWLAQPETDGAPLAAAGREESALSRGADPAGAAPEGDPAPAAGAPGREAAAAVERPAGPATEVVLLAQDAATGAPLAAFQLRVWRDGGEELDLVTDADGRATLLRPWFDAPFQLSAEGGPGWEEPGLECDLGPADRPADGEPLVLACATGPTYTLRFDQPPPAGAGLFACLERGASVPSDPRNLAELHHDGGRIWTRFGPDSSVRSPKGDEPWTLAVLARDGLWRASGPVATIVGVQPEPVWLTAEACGVLQVRLESDGGPVVGECGATLERWADGQCAQRWHYNGLVPSGQTTVYGTPAGRGTGVRSLRFEHLVPGTYRLSAGSAAHEWAGRELVVAGGVVADLTLDVPRKPGLAELRVVITSETGMLTLPALDVLAVDAATDRRYSSRYSPESTWERRVLTVEAPAGVELRLTLDGLESLGTLAWSPGTSLVARPGDEVSFLALDTGRPPMRRGGVVVRSRAGELLREAGVATYFGSKASFLHHTDAVGQAQLEPIQEGAPFDLVVLADGYRPERLRALCLTRDDKVFEVRLEPGWGAWMDVVLGGGPPSTSPRRAVGARILVDGVEAGRTDELGQVLLADDAAPRTIEVLFPGHRIAYGDIDPATHAPRAHANGPYWVVLESAER